MRSPDHQATPMNAAAFTTLSLRPELLASIATLAYDSMTPVQAQALPHLLSCKDLIAQAKTGSGKPQRLQSVYLISSTRSCIALKR